MVRTGVAGAFFAIAGCATPPPPAPAVMDINWKDCGTEFVVDAAKPLTPEKEKKWADVSTTIASDSPCYLRDGKRSNYVALELPSNPANHVITVGGLKEPIRALAPIVTLLDENGVETRGFEPSKYKNLASVFGVQFKPTDGEKFILVSTDPDLVGTVVEEFETRLTVGSGTYVAPSGYSASYNTYHGAEGKVSRTFSHEGIVWVRVQALSGKIGKPE